MPNPRRKFMPLSGMLLAASVAVLQSAGAQAQTPAATAAAWSDSITLTAYVQAGITGNPKLRRGTPALNFGHAFTDRANQVLVNQLALSLARDIDKTATGYDFGFKLQGMLGTDARYTRALGLLERTTTGQYQFDLLEANVQMHAPWFTDGGVDLKLGLFATPLGAETIDPTTNAFYTHSYIFNFGLPFKHTGALATIHVTPVVDLYLGVTTGVNTTFGKWGDNNSAVSGIAGIGLNLMDGKLTVLALTHAGPENASAAVRGASRYNRYLSDILVTYKPNDTWTLMTELNHVREELGGANGYGIAQYVSYALSDTVKLNARAEAWRDEKGFFVAAFPGNFDYVNVQLGRPATAIGARPTTYGALTLGVTYKPGLPGPLSTMMIRPEIRYDQSLNGTKPFNSGRDRGSLTLASDIVISF